MIGMWQQEAAGFRLYLGLRARFCASAGRDLVARHWQWFLLAGMLVPGLPIVSIFMVPARLFGQSLSPSFGLSHRLGMLALFQAAGVLWLLPQKAILHGGRFRLFVETLPVGFVTRCAVSGVLLAVADVLLFVPVLSGAMLFGPMSTGLPGQAFGVADALTVLLDIVFLQLGMLERLPLMVVGALSADGLLPAAYSSKSGVFGAAMLAAAVAILLTTARLAARFDPVRAFGCARRPVRGGTTGRRLLSRVSPTVRIQIGALGERPWSVGACCLLAGAIPFGTGALIGAFGHDGRSPIVAILGMAGVALLLSGLYRVLRAAHAGARTMMATLPVARSFWPVRDICLVAGFGMMPLPVFLYPLVAYRLVSPAMLGAVSLTYVGLIAGLRTVLGIGARFRLLVSLALAMAWAGSAIAGVVR
jgi:hypothetical protein